MLSTKAKIDWETIDVDKLAKAYLIGIEAEQERETIDRQAEADIARIEASGQQDRFGIDAQGSVDVTNIETQGEVDIDKIQESAVEQRETIKVQEQEAAEADLKRIEAQKTADIAKTGASGTEERETLKTAGDQQRRAIDAQATADERTIAAQGKENRATTGTKGDQDRKTIKTTGAETRKTQSEKSAQDIEKLTLRIKMFVRSTQKVTPTKLVSRLKVIKIAKHLTNKMTSTHVVKSVLLLDPNHLHGASNDYNNIRKKWKGLSQSSRPMARHLASIR